MANVVKLGTKRSATPALAEDYSLVFNLARRTWPARTSSMNSARDSSMAANELAVLKKIAEQIEVNQKVTLPNTGKLWLRFEGEGLTILAPRPHRRSSEL